MDPRRRTGEATAESRALRAAERAIANPLFDDTSLKESGPSDFDYRGQGSDTVRRGRGREPDLPGSRRGSQHHRGRDCRARSRASDAGVGRCDGHRSIGQLPDGTNVRSVLSRAGSPPERHTPFTAPDRADALQHIRVAPPIAPQARSSRSSAHPIARHPISGADGAADFTRRRTQLLAIRRLLERFAVAASKDDRLEEHQPKLTLTSGRRRVDGTGTAPCS